MCYNFLSIDWNRQLFCTQEYIECYNECTPKKVEYARSKSHGEQCSEVHVYTHEMLLSDLVCDATTQVTQAIKLLPRYLRMRNYMYVHGTHLNMDVTVVKLAHH